MSTHIKKTLIVLIVICSLSGCTQNNSIKTNYDIIESFGENYDNKNSFNIFNIVDLSINKAEYKVAIMQGKNDEQAIFIYKLNEKLYHELFNDYRGYNQSYVVYLKKENKTIVIASNMGDYTNITICWKEKQKKYDLNNNEKYSVWIFDNINKIESIKSDNSNEIIPYFLEIYI